jgi:glycerol-3-phosphate acyltransferase PlsY
MDYFMSSRIIIAFVISYLIGCIPFALLVCRFFSGNNPGKEGSGNYGALNSYEITGKKYIGALVLLLDCLKGMFAVWITYNYIFSTSLYIVVAAISVVIGHSFNVFLKFRGGRGLATALGTVVMFNAFVGGIWIILWILFYKIVKNNIIFANVWATLITPVIVIGAPDYIFFHSNYNYYVNIADYKIFSIILCAIILASHIRKLNN